MTLSAGEDVLHEAARTETADVDQRQQRDRRDRDDRLGVRGGPE